MNKEGRIVAQLVETQGYKNSRVLGSIPEGVNGNIHLYTTSGLNMPRGLTQPITQMSTRNI